MHCSYVWPLIYVTWMTVRQNTFSVCNSMWYYAWQEIMPQFIFLQRHIRYQFDTLLDNCYMNISWFDWSNNHEHCLIHLNTDNVSKGLSWHMIKICKNCCVPDFFDAYIDDMQNFLANEPGINIGGMKINYLLQADDLILLSRTIDEYDVTMPVPRVRMTSQINCDDVIMLSQKRPPWATMAKGAMDDCL